MPVIGKFKTVLVLLVLCILASIFYLRVWSSIDSGGEEIQPNLILKGSGGGSKESGREDEKKVLFRQHHVQQKQKTPQSSYRAPNDQGIPSDQQQQQQENNNKSPILSLKQIEKQRLKDLKAKEKLEKQLRKAAKLAKLEKLQQLDSEPFPALISTNNARLAALNSKAFQKFCHSSGTGKDSSESLLSGLLSWTDFYGFQSPSSSEFGAEAEWGVGNSGSITAEDSQARRIVLVDKDFETYEEWMEYISNKNSGQEQVLEPETSVMMEPIRQNVQISEQQQQSEQDGQEQTQDQQQLQQDQQDKEGEDQNSIIQLLEQRKSKVRPLFWERPLRGWIVNYTAIQEPCDRTKHTSAHCLAFLQHDHLYLVPSHAARESPNKVPSAQATFNRVKSDEDIELDTYYGSPSIVPPSAPNTMHFHIFWRGVISDKLSLAARAFLFTQPLDRSILHLWIDSTDLPNGKPENYENNPFSKDLVSKPWKNFVRLHKWDQKAQQVHAYGLSDELELLSMVVKENVPPVALSDQARFMILHRYGGMYLDADVLLLRDMSPLYDSGMEFAYEWSNTQMYNTAILMLTRKSNVARRILDGAKAKEKELQEDQAAKEKQQQGDEVDKVKQEEEQLTPKGAGEEGVDEEEEEIESEEEAEDDSEDDDEKEEEGAEKHDERLGKQKSSLEAENEAKRRTRGKPKQQSSKPMAIPVIENKEPMPQAPATPPAPPTPQAQPMPVDEDYLGPDAGDDSIFDYPVPDLYTTNLRRLQKRGEMRPKEIYHPARLRHYLRPSDGGSSILNNGLVMMPTSIFDPLWLRVDGVESKTGLANDKRFKMMEDLYSFPEAFTNPNAVCPAQKDQQEGSPAFIAGPEVFFTGAFAYHWHNNWVTPIKPQSWMGQMSKAYNDFLTGERPNLYGEWFSGDI
ncbi:hypothetical protein BGZ76_004335 [Entomortierella beljakovae]|nr:hypothetical protein BGZ76_004335 [Entomortierella beljakovae]